MKKKSNFMAAAENAKKKMKGKKPFSKKGFDKKGFGEAFKNAKGRFGEKK